MEFKRQMYSNDSDLGKMKLQAVKENLYEATTKVLQHTIEMYSQKELKQWMKTDLLEKIVLSNGKIKIPRDEAELGKVSLMDITNSITAINSFARKDSLLRSESLVKSSLIAKENEVTICNQKIEILKDRLLWVLDKNNMPEIVNSFEVFEDAEREETEDEFSLDEDDEIDLGEDDIEEDEDYTKQTEMDVFLKRIHNLQNADDIENEIQNYNERRSTIEDEINNLKTFLPHGSDKGRLKKQEEYEIQALDDLRTLRNSVYAHRVEDEVDISDIGEWEPEAGPMFGWADTIKKYLDIIELRYKQHLLFDDYYAQKEGKDKFDSCKIFVQKQINELYINNSSVTFEFAGELYDKEDEVYNFNRLIKSMAKNWSTGIRYLTVVTNDDIPEMNVFFKECLSGTSKYVDNYLINRNELRKYRGNNDGDKIDYAYFRFLYSLNPELEKIYWKGNISLTELEYARKILYSILRCKYPLQLKARIERFPEYFFNIDIYSWCENHMLSEVFYSAHEDTEGMKLSSDMENALRLFVTADGDKAYGRFNKVIRTSAKLYFFMTKKHEYWFIGKNNMPKKWNTMEEAVKYMENAENFKSYSQICKFVDETRKSEYFKQWRKEVKNA